MPINRTIYTPLTLISGSISVPSRNLATDGNLLFIPSSSMQPLSQSLTSVGVWNHVIKTNPTTTTSSVANAVRDMTLNLENGFNYIIIANYGISTTDTAGGARLGVSSSGTVEVSYFGEVPSSRTTVVYGNNAIPATTTSPTADIDNYYLARQVVIASVKSTGVTIAPTLAVNTAAANRTASMGPSVISYMKY